MITMSMNDVPGAWHSPLTAAAVTSGARLLAEPTWDSVGRPMWLESRADEDGLVALMGLAGTGPSRLSPPGFDIGSRVYGMGGGDVVPLPGGHVLVVREDDQRWWRVEPGGVCTPLTADTGRDTRFADGTLGAGGQLWCVREDSRDAGEPAHELVAIDLRSDGPAPRTVVSGPDFLAAPRPSPDGTLLAWMAWDHPHMPWDEARLLVAPVRADGTVGPAACIAGGAGAAPQQPRWLADGTLLHLVDTDGWWNPAVWEPGSGRTRRLAHVAREFAEPPWQLGARSAGQLAQGDLVVASTRGAVTQLGIVPGAGLTPGAAPHPLPVPLTYLPGDTLAVRDNAVLTVAAFADRPAALIAVRVEQAPAGGAGGAAWRELRSSRVDVVGPQWRPTPLVVTVEGPSGPLDAVYHPPTHPDHHVEPGVPPPLVLEAHGGPTARVPMAYSSATAFWTSRGFAVLHVNYGGSSGAGRAFRERLRGRWGRVDVDDCLAAVDAVAARGLADPHRVVARGASAGAYTVLRAATTGRVRAVAAWSGVTYPAQLIRGTHKFESRYVEGLLGADPPPAPVEPGGRSPCPVLLVHGTDDDVVPIAQADHLARVLRAAGGRVALLRVDGERHGLRSPTAVRRGLAAELALHRLALGLPDPDELPEPPWVTRDAGAP